MRFEVVQRGQIERVFTKNVIYVFVNKKVLQKGSKKVITFNTQ